MLGAQNELDKTLNLTIEIVDIRKRKSQPWSTLRGVVGKLEWLALGYRNNGMLEKTEECVQREVGKCKEPGSPEAQQEQKALEYLGI